MKNKILNYKDYLTIYTCSLSFALGWILTILGFFFPPQGEVSDSVLWILSQALIYCGSAIGISSYYSSKLNNFKQEVRKELDSKK